MTNLFAHIFIYLIFAVIAVPFTSRLGLGYVIGYLAAGIVIVPIFGLAGAETREIQQFVERSMAMMPFVTGFELTP